jgi:hypothetical protein
MNNKKIMKIKIVLSAFLFMACQQFYAQEVVIDSVKQNKIEQEKLEKQLKEDKKSLKKA